MNPAIRTRPQRQGRRDKAASDSRAIHLHREFHSGAPLSDLKHKARKAVLLAVRRGAQLAAFFCGVRRDHRRRNGAAPPSRILIINGGHLGDTLLASSVIPVLRSAYPQAELGFVTGSWSQAVVRNHPELAFTHVIDHWRLNRGNESVFQKVRRYISTRRRALAEIRERHYDLSLCPFPIYPDMLFFTWQAGIPRRIGYSRSLLASFASDLAEMPENLFIHQGKVYAEILRPLGISEEHLLKRKAMLPASDPAAEQEVCDLLQLSDLRTSSYRIVHIGSGNSCKELPSEFWRTIATELSKRSVLLFTGTGDRENQAIAEAIRGLNNCVNGCGRLSWSGFVTAVRGCDTLYGVDTVAGHVAAVVGTPSILVYSGIGGVAKWRPESDHCVILTNHVPCAPCYLPRGCADMKCLRGVTPDDVLNANRGFPARTPQPCSAPSQPLPLVGATTSK